MFFKHFFKFRIQTNKPISNRNQNPKFLKRIPFRILHHHPLFSSSFSSAIMTTTTRTMSMKGERGCQEELVSTTYFKDDNNFSEKPLFSRVSNFTSNTNTNNNNDKQRRRRVRSMSSQPSSGRDMVRQAAADTYLMTRLSFKLLRYLGVGYRWIGKFLAIACYALLLMPGFLQVAYYYFFSSQVRRSIVYGDQPRNRLDLYLPVNSVGKKPVVAFVTGGAWIIGYKAWGALLGQQLAERNIIVACIDYRNFPQGTISDMVEDASQGISFVCNNIAEYGGDPTRIYLMGQSAGAHITACALMEQASRESEKGEKSWTVSQIKAFFGISGGYNIPNLVDHFHGRGLDRSIFLSIMDGEKSLRRFSPEIIVQEPSFKRAASILPPIVLLHGTEDRSIPSDASKTFTDALQKVGAQAELFIYEGKTHTDLFLQDPLRGGTDQMLKDIFAIIRKGNKETTKDEVFPPRRRLVPEFMLQLARKISPF